MEQALIPPILQPRLRDRALILLLRVLFLLLAPAVIVGGVILLCLVLLVDLDLPFPPRRQRP